MGSLVKFLCGALHLSLWAVFAAGMCCGEDRFQRPQNREVLGGSYRFATTTERLARLDLPGWFLAHDKNKDGQVQMHEFTNVWSDELAQQFARCDPNKDGTITPHEAQLAMQNGLVPTHTDSQRGAGRRKRTSADPTLINRSNDRRYTYAKKVIATYDRDRDSRLGKEEWSKAAIYKALYPNADADTDGFVSETELALSMK